MVVLEVILLLVLLVLIADVLGHYLPKIPVTLIQVTLGVLIALIFNWEINLETDWFMLLFVGPLLFNDGRHFPKKELWQMRGPIIGNAIILVLLTTLIGGYVIYLIVPQMPLSASFALAAILSPTDPVAVQSIAKQAKLPSGILHLVAGESLINDASGLIGFKYGIAATMTGVFSLTQATGDFIYISVMGAIVGALLMLLINGLRWFFLQQGLEDLLLHTVLEVITPFFVYFIAEECLHASGVIAVVVAGLLHQGRPKLLVEANPELKMMTEQTWAISIYLLNGIVFVLLGIELPLAMGATLASESISLTYEVSLIVIVWLVILLVRMVWTWLNLISNQETTQKYPIKTQFKLALLSGLTGVRGAITMVGVLSVPTLLNNGKAFPGRSLMLYIAGGVILVSLLAAMFIIPLLTHDDAKINLRGTRHETEHYDETLENQQLDLAEARIFMYQMAMQGIELQHRLDNDRAALDLLKEYQHLIGRQTQKNINETNGQELPDLVVQEIALKQIGIAGEKAELEKLIASKQVTTIQAKRLRKVLAYRQQAIFLIGQPVGYHHIRLFLHAFKIGVKHSFQKLFKGQIDADHNVFHQLEKQIAKAGLLAISDYLKKAKHQNINYNRQVIYQVILQYRNRFAKHKVQGHVQHHYEKQLQSLRIAAIASQREAINLLLDQQRIDWQIATQLKKEINSAENIIIAATNDLTV